MSCYFRASSACPITKNQSDKYYKSAYSTYIVYTLGASTVYINSVCCS